MSEDNSVALIKSWALKSNEVPVFFYFIVLVTEKAQSSSWKKEIVTKSCGSCGGIVTIVGLRRHLLTKTKKIEWIGKKILAIFFEITFRRIDGNDLRQRDQ